MTKALLCAPVFTVENVKYGVLQVLNKRKDARPLRISRIKIFINLNHLLMRLVVLYKDG